MKNTLFALIAMLMFCGCSDASSSLEDGDGNTRNEEDFVETGTWVTSHFVTNYIVPNAIATDRMYDGTILISFEGDDHDTTGKTLSEMAKYFTELYGDTSYEGAVYPGAFSALAYPIDKATISCDKDFDAEHPAGEPLDDIVRFDFVTCYDFIQNGYKLNAKYEYHEYYSLPLNEINADVTKLISLYFTNENNRELKFDSAPDEKGEYNFTLSMTINGKTLTTTFTHTFE